VIALTLPAFLSLRDVGFTLTVALRESI